MSYINFNPNSDRKLVGERMLNKLEDMMEDASTEKQRRALQQCIDKLEQQ